MRIQNKTIFIESGTGDKVTISGRPYGNQVRKDLRILELDNDDNQYIVKVKETVRTIAPSFFLGLFGDSVRNLGLVRFHNKYNFECEAHITKRINNGIRMALIERSPVLEDPKSE